MASRDNLLFVQCTGNHSGGDAGYYTPGDEDRDDIGDESPNLLLHWDPSAILRDGFETGDLRLWWAVP